MSVRHASTAFFLSCMAIGIHGMTLSSKDDLLTPRWLSYLPGAGKITPVYKCFAAGNTEKCLADALGKILPAEETDFEEPDSSADDLRTVRHLKRSNGTDTSDEDDNMNDEAETKELASFKEGRRRRRPGQMVIPAAIGMGAIIMTMIVGVVGLVAGKALALSFLALVITIALSTRVAASNQRSTVLKEDLPDALAEISQQLVAEGALSDDAIAYQTYIKRNG